MPKPSRTSDSILGREDPTVFARCDACRPKIGQYYGKSFTERKWARGPKCDNCGTPLTLIRRINIED